MSYWTTWYVADESDAARIANISDDVHADLPQLILDSIIQTDIDDLAELLNADYITEMELLHPDPMVIAVPDSLVAAIAALTDTEIEDVAGKWASMDDSGIRSQIDLFSLVKSMRKFCSQSVSASKRIIELPA